MTDAPPDMPRFLPVGLDIRTRRCVVVGGGSVGTRKALTLLRAGAGVTVVSPTTTPRLATQIGAGRVHWVADSFREAHLVGAFLVVAATDDDAVNATVARLARRRGALLNDASSSERSQVIFGALLERDDATIAVFTDGRDPRHARRTRDRIAQRLAPERPSKDRA